MSETVISADFTLHPAQAEIFNSDAKFCVLVCGRRFGKSTIQVNRNVIDSIMFPSLMPDYTINSHPMQTVTLLGMPTLKQAKRNLWKPILQLFSKPPFDILVKKIHKADHIITLIGNRPEIHVVGLNDNNGDNVRGFKIWRAGVDEVQDVKREIIDSVILPAMGDTPNSRGLFSGTPKGRANILWELRQRCDNPLLSRDWRFFNYPTWTNTISFPEGENSPEVLRAKATLSSRLFEQEFMASFVNFEGQIFGDFDRVRDAVEALPKGFRGFWIGVDPGDVNPAAVLVGLGIDNKFYVIDAWQGGDGANPVPESEVIAVLIKWATKYPVQRVYVDPSRPGVIFDIRVAGSSWNKRIEGLCKAIKGYNKITEGVQLINNLFYQDRLKISNKVDSSFLDNLESYHRRKNRDGIITEDIAPNQDDHTIDALRYALASIHNLGGGRSLWDSQNIIITS
jgi:hypothetical protein